MNQLMDTAVLEGKEVLHLNYLQLKKNISLLLPELPDEEINSTSCEVYCVDNPNKVATKDEAWVIVPKGEPENVFVEKAKFLSRRVTLGQNAEKTCKKVYFV